MKSLAVPVGGTPPTVLKSVQQQYIDWMHACGGKGRCTTCRFQVLAGMENLAPLNEAEQRYASRGELKPDERLGCQAVIHGDITIRVPDACQLPHITYSE